MTVIKPVKFRRYRVYVNESGGRVVNEPTGDFKQWTENDGWYIWRKGWEGSVNGGWGWGRNAMPAVRRGELPKSYFHFEVWQTNVLYSTKVEGSCFPSADAAKAACAAAILSIEQHPDRRKGQ